MAGEDDFDEFDDDLADEDFLNALDHASSLRDSHKSQLLSSKNTSGPQRPINVELEGLPSDAFSSPEPPSKEPAPLSTVSRNANGGARNGLNRTGSGVYRQTTLWGGDVVLDGDQTLQGSNTRVYRADKREMPSHHELNREAMQTWVYPTNLGAIRDYQFSIVKNSLFNNTLVALPTGLGKTFIAATVMLNFYRWTESAKIVFVAPTKPLVAQQVSACYGIAGIPRSDTTMLTGDINSAYRADDWKSKRVFFMTPQTLMNDLSHGCADPKSIVLLVIDEAHRATGEYSYAKVAKFIRRFSTSIRVLALTATPGSKVETVQEVIDNLGISHCEIRTEESLDIRQYVHQRNIDQVILEPSDEMNLISDLFTKALKPLTEKLSSQNIWYGRSPMALTAYGLVQQQREWMATRGRHVNQGVQFMMRAIFSVLTSIAHSIKLFQFHGIKPFYDNMIDFRSEQETKGQKGSKYKRQIIENPNFQEMMDKIAMWMKIPDFVGHPKLAALAETVLNHFVDHGDSTRVIVFSEYRDSAEDIVRTLNKHKPMIKASVFVGQADGKRGEGMRQVKQIETIESFRKGVFNVLVATSIGEEGLDIGQVDLIVCYDSSSSPIRMLQRMGRTGRKREGNIVLLLMRGKEEEQFAKSKDNYERMQQLICEGSRFDFRFDLSTRIVPKEIRPEVDKRHVEIPIENTQDISLPDPRKRRAAPGKKRAPKKFHVPDGVKTGFQKVSDILRGGAGKSGKTAKASIISELKEVAVVPELQSVLLKPEELKELDRTYRDLPFNRDAVEETDMPSMAAFPELQRQARPVVHVKHGHSTQRFISLLEKIGNDPDSLVRDCRVSDTSNYLEIPVPSFVGSDGEDEGSSPLVQSKKHPREVSRQTGQVTGKRRGGTKPTNPTRAPKGARNAAPGSRELRSQEEAGENEFEQDAPARPAPKRQRGRPAAGKGRNKQGQNKAGINSDEVGDDCERDSDLVESDGSDQGEDLVDFIVFDEDEDQIMTSTGEPPSTMESLLSSRTPVAAHGRKPYFVPTEFMSTQNSDGLPDLGSVTKTSSKKRGRDEEDEEDTMPRRPSARSRRTVVYDSESDE